ncbi:hypothetical protein [Hyalangium gracile]|uniref:hypothetical protein n=1 Tax=Hyalangium gracile TaxID=394092 RepID=UPI001CC9790F|nr:hypothetical protein [Hyalangium gracile]
MQQAYGLILGGPGTVYAGSGNFSVTKGGSGIYFIDLQGTFSSIPVVVASPSGPYITAQVLLVSEDESSSKSRIRLETGYTDQSSRMDCDFSFHAFWS